MGASDWIAVAAVAVALASWVLAFVASVVSIGIAVWQGFETRRHNRKSVTAALSLNVSVNSKHDDFGISLASVGLGPAVVTGVDLFLDGREFSSELEDSWRAIWPKAGLRPHGFTTTTISIPSIMPPGHTCLLLGYGGDSITEEQVLNFMNAAKRVDIRTKYESIFGDAAEARIEISSEEWNEMIAGVESPPPPTEE